MFLDLNYLSSRSYNYGTNLCITIYKSAGPFPVITNAREAISLLDIASLAFLTFKVCIKSAYGIIPTEAAQAVLL